MRGNGFLGSESLQTSVANQEILPPSPSNWTYRRRFNKLSLMNDQDCTLVINNQKGIFLREGQGFNVEQSDTPVSSLKIVEDGITFNWIGGW
ncbi:hypothetical protein ACI2JA_04045 [Alkalihalobacillus sp. NPDC078783]